jgi:hypothetical protein
VQGGSQDGALSANDKPGQNRKNATKLMQVKGALSMERHQNKSDREITKLCEAKHTCVVPTGNPHAKVLRANNIKKYFEKAIVNKIDKIKMGENSTLMKS